jgi:predicted HicB family RNase H-like nuclease
MPDDVDVSMAYMKRFGQRASATLAGRRERETRQLSRSDRQSISAIPRKDRQLNLKITPELYERIAALARNARLSMPQWLERATAAYVEKYDR